MKNHYTTTEVSRLLGVTTATINGWIKTGEINSFKTPGGHNRIRKEVLLDFLVRNNIPVPPELDVSSRPKILIVEDDEDVRDFVSAVIDDLEYSVDLDIAIDGYMAGNKVIKFSPDIVILDIMLPGLNGFEICRKIREELGGSIKIIAITGYYSEENKTKIMDAGADYFMKKPMLLDEFRKILDKAIMSFSGKYILSKKSKKEVANG